MTDFRRTVRDAYDEIAVEHDRHRSAEPPEMDLVRSFAGDLADGARVLDAGCGAGDPVASSLSDQIRVVGLDFSAGQLALASERAPAARLVRGDMTELPFGADRFDALCSIYAVIHVPDERHATVFEEFHRVCRPGAPVLVTVGTSDWQGTNEDWMETGAEMRWDIPGPERTRRLMRSAGFVVESTEGIADDVAAVEDAEKLFVRARATA